MTVTSAEAEIERACAGLPDTDPGRIGATDDLAEAVRQAAALVVTEPAYSTVAARLLARLIADETGPISFGASIAEADEQGLLNERTAAFVAGNIAALDALVDHDADDRFTYFGLRTRPSCTG
jgi:ribonucleoside-diphosphate reductase alpha chain